MSSLNQKAVSGVIWNGFQRFGTLSISFLTNIVLARILLPEDFGSIGMLMVFIGISNTIIDGGFASALIQKSNPNKDDYSTVFLWNLFLSICLYISLFAFSEKIERFYNIEGLSLLLKVQGCILIIDAFSTVQSTKLKKELKFRSLSKINIIATFFGSVIGITFAYFGFGVWALVYKYIFQSVLLSILLWSLSDWKPSFKFSTKSFKQLFSFGSLIFLSNITESVVYHLQSLIIGRFFSPKSLGYYTQAKQLHEIPERTIPIIVDQVAFPLYSSIQNEKKRVIKGFKQSLSILCYINFPVMIILIIISKPLIVLLYSEKWIPSTLFFQILCLGGMLYSINSNNVTVVKSLGKSNYVFISTAIKRVSTIVFLFVGLNFGVNGVVAGYVFSVFTWVPINAYFTGKLIDFGFKQQIVLLLPTYLLSVCVGIVVYLVSIYLVPKDFLPITVILLQTFLYCIFYFLLSYIFKLKSFFFLINILKQNFSNK